MGVLWGAKLWEERYVRRMWPDEFAFLLDDAEEVDLHLSLIHISEPTRLLSISYAVFCLKKKKKKKNKKKKKKKKKKRKEKKEKYYVLWCVFFFLMIRRPQRSTRKESSAASDVYKRQLVGCAR